VALRRKKLGLWEELSWDDYAAGVRAVASALIELGVKPGEPVALISENRVEWLMCDLGILTSGAVTCAMYTTSATEQVGYIMQHAAARILFAENEEQLDKALEIRQSHPIERIVVLDDKGLRRFQDPSVMLWDEFVQLGTETRERNEVEIERRLAALRPDDLAILVYTSGTTGPPKGVMLSHTNLDWACRSMSQVVKPAPNDELLSFLPLCHIAERTITVFNQVINGSIVNFAENLDTVRENLAEVRPHVFFAVPRIWEKLYNTIELRMRDASFAKRHLYTWGVAVGRAVNAARQRALREGRDPDQGVPPGLQLAYLAADQAVLRPLREKLGFDRTRFAISGAAPISPDVISYFQAIGVPLVEGYGQTESTAIITVNPAGASQLGTVGLPVDGVELKIADDGEILARSAGVMLGYYKEAEATAMTIDADGWLHTGDVGEIGETGRLRITDRKKDLIITSGGKNIAPQYIESKLRCSAYIHDAVVIGERRKFVTALVILDEDNLMEWAQKNRIQFGAYAELARSSEVTKLIDREIEEVNKTLTHVEAIKKFRVLERRLDRDEGELTPTLKVRRKIVEEKYESLIDAMYRS
jgi:long-chain acyl-CoA synthetase